MSPILGIYASSMQPALNASSYESIATYTIGAGGSSGVTFSSIPSTYKHLQLRIFAQCNRTNGNGDTYLRFNSDTGNNYSYHRLQGNGAAAASTSATSTGIVYAGYEVGSWATNQFSAMVVDILDYTNTNKYKTVRSLGGNDQNGATASNGDPGTVTFFSSLWMNTNAINSILVFDGSYNFTQYTSIALYGIKG